MILLIAYDITRISFIFAAGSTLKSICITDNLSGKIINKLILESIRTTGIYTAVFFLFSLTGHIPSLSPSWFLSYLFHVLILSLMSVILWKMRLWPAGDSKLFFVCGLLPPLLMPEILNFPFMLSFSLLLNILLPAAAVFIAEAAADLYRQIAGNKFRPELFMQHKNVSDFFSCFLVFFLARYIRTMLMSFIKLDNYVFFALMIFIYPVISRLLKNIRISLFLLLLLFLMFIFTVSSHELVYSAFISIGLSLPFIVLRKLMEILMQNDSIMQLQPKYLREGVIITDRYKEIIKKAYPEFFDGVLYKIYPDGLSIFQANMLSKLIKEDNNRTPGLVPLEVRRGKPFAVWITAGLVLTLLINGENIAALCKKIILLISGLI
ncbi:MAG: hypothetical protein J6Z08_05995 [Elusimicrobiales bacterium]|nr:hypothetical protein [Elusimicrobiales bacterium]